MSRTARLFICLIALLTLFTLLWPGRVEASRLAACLTTVTVANTNDSGSGSLRQALADVCSGGTVDFAAGLANQTITLTSAELSITKTVTITNPNAANLKVSGNKERRVFSLQTSAVATISNLSIISGTAVVDGCENNPCGGGILLKNYARLTINNSTLIGNSAEDGGGIFGGFYNTLIVNSSIFSGNTATSQGGGIYIYSGSTFTVNNSTFRNNHAGYGGSITNFANATINNSTFINNSADMSAGGIYHAGSRLRLNNSTLSNNLSNYHTGGIYIAGPAVLTITNSTLSGNLGENFSGNLENAGTLHLLNSILANTNGSDCDSGYIFATNINNLVEDGTCNAAFSGDPNLGPLQNNGGATLTHALLPGSPAIDAGDATTCLSTDQRGVVRPIDGNGDNTAVCDIGAFEAPDPSTPAIQFTQAT
ncbi:MAG: hypothetical protein HS126_22275 [Anaerolineales bacterium]|nr:hypothetical protein [Anaerolineales bacterium]